MSGYGRPKEGNLVPATYSTNGEPSITGGGKIVWMSFEFQPIAKKFVWVQFPSGDGFKTTDARHDGSGTAAQASSQGNLVESAHSDTRQSLTFFFKDPPHDSK